MSGPAVGYPVSGTFDDGLPTRYHLTGMIVDSRSGRPIPGLRVRTYDKDFFRDQLLGDGHTDDNGRYEITFDREDLTGPLVRLERHPDLFVVVFDQAGRQIYSTERSVVVDAGRETTIDLRIPYGPEEAPETGVVDLFGVAVNVVEAARLSAEEVVSAYRLLHNGRSQLPWYGTFDQLGYYDAAATELDSHETTWSNFLVANYRHRLQIPGGPGLCPRVSVPTRS